VALSLLALGHNAARAPAPLPTPPLHLDTVPYSKKEVDYPAMRAMHEASSFRTAEEVIAWREAVASASAGPAPPRAGQSIALDPLSDAAMPSDTIEEVILRRGSSRRFTGGAIDFTALSTILDRSTRGIPRISCRPACLN